MSNGPLVRYDAACRAITEARSVDELLQIHGKARVLAADDCAILMCAT